MESTRERLQQAEQCKRPSPAWNLAARHSLAASAQDVGHAQPTAAPQAGRKRIELSPWRACSLLFRAPALRVDLPLIEAIQDQHRCSALSAHAQGKRWIVEQRSTRPRTCLQQRFPQRLKILNSRPVQIILLFPQSARWGFLLHSNDWRLRLRTNCFCCSIDLARPRCRLRAPSDGSAASASQRSASAANRAH